MMKAFELKQVDDEFRAHRQAYLDFVVKAEKSVGRNKTKPVFEKFDDFYDYERRLKEIDNHEESSLKPRKLTIEEKMKQYYEKEGGKK